MQKPQLTDIKGKIWKILPNHDASLLLIESRDASKRTCYFSIYDCLSHQIVNSNIVLKDKWWITIKGIGNKTWIAQAYQGNENPLSKGVYLLNLEGKTLEYLPAYGYYANDQDKFYLQNTSEDQQTFFSWDEGLMASISEIPQLTVPSWNDGWILPTSYTKESSHFSSCQEFIHWIDASDAIAKIDYLEFKNHLILQYYRKAIKGIEERLIIFNPQSEKLVYSKSIQNLDGKISEFSFFVCRDRLFLFDDERKLSSLSIF
ncbi:MAG: DUF4905 domain-containing protein [Cyclobacteriaceae bacterium]|nr:DUF4905 domain-containing protein [Cyclobacteriaceae bacterium]MCH8516990.1 DUF4905 domain-containing protein [Cyclobacteriaceae bacterium]